MQIWCLNIKLVSEDDVDLHRFCIDQSIMGFG